MHRNIPADPAFNPFYKKKHKGRERKGIEGKREVINKYLNHEFNPKIEEVEGLPGGIPYFLLDNLVNLIISSGVGDKKLVLEKTLSEMSADNLNFPGRVSREQYSRALERHKCIEEVYVYCKNILTQL